MLSLGTAENWLMALFKLCVTQCWYKCCTYYSTWCCVHKITSSCFITINNLTSRPKVPFLCCSVTTQKPSYQITWCLVTLPTIKRNHLPCGGWYGEVVVGGWGTTGSASPLLHEAGNTSRHTTKERTGSERPKCNRPCWRQNVCTSTRSDLAKWDASRYPWTKKT